MKALLWSLPKTDVLMLTVLTWHVAICTWSQFWLWLRHSEAIYSAGHPRAHLWPQLHCACTNTYTWVHVLKCSTDLNPINLALLHQQAFSIWWGRWGMWLMCLMMCLMFSMHHSDGLGSFWQSLIWTLNLESRCNISWHPEHRVQMTCCMKLYTSIVLSVCWWWGEKEDDDDMTFISSPA